MDQFNLLNYIPLGAFVLGNDFRVVSWNICLEDWTKISATEIVGKKLDIYFPYLMQPRYASRIQQIFQGGAPTIFSSQLHSSFIPSYRPDGKLRIQHTTVTAIPTEEGGYYALFIIQDVTDMSNRLQECRLIQNQYWLEIQERRKAQDLLNEKSQELQQSNWQLTQLTNMSEMLQSCLTLEEAYKIIAESAKLLFPKIGGAIFVLNPSQNLLEMVAKWGDNLNVPNVFKPDQCWALRMARPHIIQNSESALVCQHIQGDFNQCCCIPLMTQGEALGVLSLSSTDSDDLIEIQQLSATTFTEHISLALANIKLRETLEKQRMSDPLTGLFNRTYLEEFLLREIPCAAQKGQPLGIIMLELDRFASCEPPLPLETRDIFLQELGDFLRANLRPWDVPCRYENQELTVILPQTDLATTKEQAEHLRQRFKDLFAHKHRLLGKITLSLGVSSFPAHGNDFKSLLQSAYSALIRAQRQGGDRTVVSE